MTFPASPAPVAIVTVGLPASGKSTAAAALVGFQDVNLDDCRAAICGDAGNQAVTGEALTLQARQIEAAIEAGVSVVVSNTNLVPAHREALVSQFRAAGYDVVLMHFDVPVEVCKARNAARSRVVPDEAMDRMARTLADNPPQACADALGVPLVVVGG